MDLPDKKQETEDPKEKTNGDVAHFLTDEVQENLNRLTKEAYLSVMQDPGSKPQIEAYERLLEVYAEKPYGMYAVRKILFDKAHGDMAVRLKGVVGQFSTMENVALNEAYRSGRYSALMEVFQFLNEENLKYMLDKARHSMSAGK